MIIGHLPAGFILSTLLLPRFQMAGVACTRFLLTGMLGSIAPDFDMVYFYLVDHRRHHHHAYFTHFPLAWASLLLVSTLWLLSERQKRGATLAFIFSLNGLAHLALDSIAGDIWWFAPFINKRFSLFTVPALYKPWWLNFFLHWSFALELVLVGFAVYLWRRTLQRGFAPTGTETTNSL
jgi:hypothetical protein